MQRPKRSRPMLLLAGLLILAAPAPAAVRTSIDVIASQSVVVQPDGPRPGDAGKAYCNIQGQGTGDPKFASFAILDFTAPRGEASTKVQALTLTLTQSVARFTRDGKVRFFLASEAGVGLEALARPLRFDPGRPDGLGKQVPRLLPLGPGEFARGETGDVDTYPLAPDDDARKVLDDQIHRGATIRIIAVPVDAHVAATFFGAGAREVANRPKITLDVPRTTDAVVSLALFSAVADVPRPFAIEVVDPATGRGVPLIELRTVNEIRYVTDSHGLVAFDEPGLMGRKVFFHVKGHGYEFPRDGFGIAGKALDVVAGGSARIEVRRVNVAERLYRVTGAGIYRDSVLLGRPVPIREPALNAQVFGSDSVQGAVFRGKIQWFWGDTNRPSYPLGLFDAPTATSRLPGEGGLDPEVGIDLDYAVGPDGFAAGSAKMPGAGPTWIDGVTVLKDSSGPERMFAAYAKIKPPMDVYERGLIEFDPETRRFSRLTPIPLDTPARPYGHTFHHAEGGTEFVYFADPFPLVRVRADVEAWKDPGQYEAFTCLLPDSTPEAPKIDRAEDGSARYAWRKGAAMLDGPAEDRLLRAGTLDRADALVSLRDADTGRAVVAHRGSVYRNAFRDRWVLIATELGGTSMLGEAWFAEADTPLGPWAYARKVVTHDKYSFYNPKQHPMFAKDGGRTIFFEGTYTASFSGNTDPTPRYDYNQVLYKLDLGDDRLALPVPVYRRGDGLALRAPGRPVAFFALDRPGPRTLPVRLGDIQVHALPADLADAPATSTLLFEAPGRDGAPPAYLTEQDRGDRGRTKPIARVWKAPTRVILPGG